MIISPPFLPPRGANQTDAEWLDVAMSGVVPGHIPRRGDNVIAGSYPVSLELGWHGGLHLLAPTNAQGQALPVRVIADGTVVYARAASTITDKQNDPLNYGADADGDRCSTNDGVVVVRHTTDIGANAQGQAVSVTFYSVYMHLYYVDPTIAIGRQIYRKTELGEAGYIYGQPNRMHFEIFCDDTNLALLVGRSAGDLPLDRDGRSDVVFGEIYFHLPAGTPVYDQKPLLNNPIAHRQPPAPHPGAQLPPPQPLQPVYTTTEALVAGVRYAGGDARAVNQRGDAVVTSYHLDGAIEGQPLTEQDAEYNLYLSANEIWRAYPNNARPTPSAVYELLRFGRVINTAHETLNPANVPHWRRIRYPGGQGWVNLNAANVRKFSDADFPHWKQWRLIDDSADQDSRCDSPTIKGWFDANHDNRVDAGEINAGVQNAGILAKLEHAICKFPIEWDSSTIDKRWSWLKTTTTENPDPLSKDNFDLFEKHARALCFWGNIAAQTPALPASPWRVHPKLFIQMFRRNLWLSESDLGRIYRATSRDIRERYRIALNQVTRKYSYTNPVRLSHFLGQGAIESTFLRSMQESSMLGNLQGNNFYGTSINAASKTNEASLGHWYGAIATEDDAWFRSNKYNSMGGFIASSYNWRNGNLGDPHAQQYRGRGFKQLTGLVNYASYWVYRGWLDRSSFDADWWTDPQYVARNAAHMTLRPPDVADPHRATETPYNCMDTGGWYLGAERPNTIREIDRDSREIAVTQAEQNAERVISRAVTHAINGGDLGANERLHETRSAKEVVL